MIRWINKLKVKRLELIQGASSASINQISVSPCCSSACSHDTCIFSILCLHSSILENTRERVGDVGTKYNDYEMIYRQADLFHSDHETTTEPRGTTQRSLYRIVACLLEKTRGIGKGNLPHEREKERGGGCSLNNESKKIVELFREGNQRTKKKWRFFLFSVISPLSKNIS